MEFDRRQLITAALAAVTLSGVRQGFAQSMSREVAGVVIPSTAITEAAIAVARGAAPPLLFNHSMRVFLFGCLYARAQRIAHDAELVLVAALFHDLGLLDRFSSERQPFEVDGADAVKAFLRERHVEEGRAEAAWRMVALHTSAAANHFEPQVRLINIGASVDFYGAYSRIVMPAQRDLVVAAFPRLGFKAGIQDLLVQYCRRKPAAQAGSWTDVFCQAHVTDARFPSISSGLASSPYSE